MTFRITLISPHADIWAMGTRQISSCLAAAGYETRLVFLPDPEEHHFVPCPHRQDYPAVVLGQVCELCADADLIGISVMSNFFGRARALTEALHRQRCVPVIWGGIHPTVRPTESLQWADMVCVGEGEEAIVELVGRMAAGQDWRTTANIWTRDEQGGIIANPLRSLNTALDSLPLPDYELPRQYICHAGRLVPLTPSLLEAYTVIHNFGGTPRVSAMTYLTRGCPYECTYCCNNALARLYPHWRRIRRRDPGRVVAEIEIIRRLLPNLGGVVFSDETMLALSIEELQRFSTLYRERIGLPFITSTSPETVTAEKVGCLVEAGLVDVMMGIQSGSPAIRSLFHRHETDEQVLNAARCLNRFRQQIPSPRYDVIVDNPYETDADRLATLRLAYQLPRPHRLQSFSLTFYPGTDLYRRAHTDGLIQDDERDVYRKNYSQMAYTYYNLLVLCFHYYLPRPFLWLLTLPAVFRLGASAIMRGPVYLLWKLIDALRMSRIRRKHHLDGPR